jgi:hypothetical protein
MSERSYTHRSLTQKLGIDKAESVLLLRPPSGYIDELGGHQTAGELPYDFIQVFTASSEQLTHEFPFLKNQLSKEGMLWVSWPKKTADLKSDLNENIIRDIGLENGLVDVKVISVNQQWSGLKFVYRKKDR